MALIVTAEDHEDIRLMTTRSLQRVGHVVIATTNGEQALDAIRQHHPDAVVTDIDMPRMTGLELCRAIRDDPQLRDIPILVVSGSIHPDDPQAAACGATDVLAKPHMPNELVERLAVLLE
jgi:CheY-like chemotaxis protein